MSEQQPFVDFTKHEEHIYNEYSDLAEYVDMFDSTQKELFATIRLTMDSEGKESFYDAKMMVRAAIENNIENLEMLSTVIFDQIESSEGVKAWATLVHGYWTDLDDVLSSINPIAGFEVPDISDLQINAIALFDGMRKKRDDNVQDDYYDLEVQHLDEPGDESQQNERDEYSKWVLNEQRADTFNNISRLLELHTPDFEQ
jgi:hypothetical protein